MCSVQLSVGSLGAAKGRFPQRARRNVCRSLFGPVDHDELNRDTDAKLREIYERDEKRWNFNFVSGTPLHGEYEWEGSAVEATPVFYQESVQVGKRRAVTLQLQAHTHTPNPHTTVRDRTPRGAPSPRTQSCTRGTTRKRSKTSRRFTTDKSTSRITDFYTKRKKEGRERSHPVFCSEQTPRKRAGSRGTRL